MDFLNNYFKGNSTSGGGERYKVENLEIQDIELMSEGGFGYVWKSELLSDNRKLVAVKKMHLQCKE